MGLEFINYYQVLGVPEFASTAQIKAAYLALSRVIERDYDAKPRVVHGVRITPGVLKLAYQVLSSPQERAEFDLTLLEEREALKYQDIKPYETSIPVKPAESLSYNEMLYWEGMEHLNFDRFDQALVCFNKLSRLERDNPIIQSRIAIAYLGSGSDVFAANAASKAIELEPDNEEFYLLLGKIYEWTGKLSSATKYYRIAYKINPNNPTAYKQQARGSLVWEKLGSVVYGFLKNFLPDPTARSFQYQDGYLTWDMVVRIGWDLCKRLHPLPSSLTFRYTGVW